MGGVYRDGGRSFTGVTPPAAQVNNGLVQGRLTGTPHGTCKSGRASQSLPDSPRPNHGDPVQPKSGLPHIYALVDAGVVGRLQELLGLLEADLIAKGHPCAVAEDGHLHAQIADSQSKSMQPNKCISPGCDRVRAHLEARAAEVPERELRFGGHDGRAQVRTCCSLGAQSSRMLFLKSGDEPFSASAFRSTPCTAQDRA